MVHNKRKFLTRGSTKGTTETGHGRMELPLGSCYVGVGGYGTVEIRAVHGQTIPGKSVRLALPCRTDGTGEGECVLQPSDILVIVGAHGEIARIPVQRVIDRQRYAGFRILTNEVAADTPATEGSDTMRAFEAYLAGVSARDLNEQERQERNLS